MIRIATPEDFELVKGMALKFLAASGYTKYSTEDKISLIVNNLLQKGVGYNIVLLYEDKGMLAGFANPFTFGEIYVASELAWWVNPEDRGSSIGKQLMEKFEEWARRLGCTCVTMASLDETLGKYYEKLGYTLYERAYMKEL